MFSELLAKSETKRSSAETIVAHTKELLARHAQLKVLYPQALSEKEWQLLYDAAYYHDVGKANTKFQNKLRVKEEQLSDPLPSLPEVPHAYLSCAYMPVLELLKKYSKNEVRLLLMAVYYHHERDEERIEETKQMLLFDLPQYVDILAKDFHIRPTLKLDYTQLVDKDFLKKDIYLYQFVRIKGLLNKLDYAASAHLEVEIPSAGLSEKVDRYFHNQGYTKNALQSYLAERQQENQVIIASTGIGKTEAALFWIGGGKGIFTLPLKVSINAIYDRVHKDFKYEQVGLLHSDSHLEYMKRSKEQEFNLVAVNHTKQLSMPLTITTLDQIIDFVGRYPGFELKLAMFSYSKLVIDEIQMYSPRLVAFLVMGLKYITEMGGKFLIMTATLPPLFIEALQQEGIHFNMPEQPFLKLNAQGNVMQRHVMKVVERALCIDEICLHNLEQKVLIIVNTVKKAQELYQHLKERKIDSNLLHSLFIKEHRQEKEAQIKDLGKRSCNAHGIWITTQLVEASIDIDFDILLTELSDATGLFQRMGRVYRGREYMLDTPNVYVFTGEPLPSGISATSKKSVVDYTIYEKSKEVLLKYDNQPLSEALKMDIVSEIYSRATLGEECAYVKEFDATLQKIKDMLPYEEKGKPKLRDIQTVEIIPDSVYKAYLQLSELEQNLGQKLSVEERLKYLMELQQYTLPIPKWAYEKAHKQNLIGHMITVNRYTQYPVVAFQYSKEKGLLYTIDEDSPFL